MYVCLCNSLKDKDIQAAIDGGAKCAKDVYKQLGCQPECCKCVPYVQQSCQTTSASSSSLS